MFGSKTQKNSDDREPLLGSSDLDHQDPPPPYQDLEKEQLPQDTQPPKKSLKDAEQSIAQASSTTENSSWLDKIIKGITKSLVPESYQELPHPLFSFVVQSRPPLLKPLRHKYNVRTIHIPPTYQSDAVWKDSPWMAEFMLGCTDLRNDLPRHIPWRANSTCTFVDQLEIVDCYLVPGRKMFRRTIVLGVGIYSGGSGAWSVWIHLWHQDSRWLAAMSRFQLENYISLQSAVLYVNNNGKDCNHHV